MTPNHANPKKPVVALVMDRYSSIIHKAVASFARQAGWTLDATMAVASERYPMSHANAILAVYVISDRTRQWLKRHKGIPIIHIWLSETDIAKGWSGVAEDSEAVGRLAAEYFLGLGFEHFAFYQRWHGPRSDLRGAAFLRTVAKQGRKGRAICCGTGKRNHIVWLSRELQRLPKPLALFVQDDLRGAECLYACRQAGLPVPDEVAILGVGNDELMTHCCDVPLSSVDIQSGTMAQAAGAMLARELAKPSGKQQVERIFPAGVVDRRSSDTRAVKSTTVLRALRHIRDHLPEDISPSRIAVAVGCTRRWLDHEFMRHIGAPCTTEITRQRIARAIQLLHDTGDNLETIAASVGISNPPRFFRQFKQVTGMTPGQYRTAGSRGR